MADVLDRNFDFATNGTVTAAGLHSLIDNTDIYAGLISTQEEKTTVGTADLLLVADSSSIGSPQIAPNRTTVYNLFDDALTGGTYANAQLSGNLTYGTAAGQRTISTSATITTGTITTGVIPTLTAGTTTSTAATITSGTITNLASTTGTIGTFNSTTGTITNLSTTLAGDFTISQGTGTLGTSGVTLGTYGSVTAIPFLTVNAKGIITSATSGTFSTIPAGAVMSFAMNSAPSGWLGADGSAVNRTTYADLFASTGTTFGTGDGSTTFNLPDLRGIFVRASGSQTINGTAFSGTFAAKQEDELKAHTHNISGSGSVSGSFGFTAGNGASSVSGPTGGTETRPANIALFYCIKF